MPRLPQHLANLPVGREQLSREVLVDFHRERILDAATGVFAKRGYQATTVDNIVAAAKASVGNFYQHFDGKEDAFLSVFDRVVKRGRERIADATAGRKDWSELAYVGLRELLEVYVEDQFSARIVLIEAKTAGLAAAARYNELSDAAGEWLRQGRRRYRAASRLPQTFEQAAVSGTAYYLHQQLLVSEQRSSSALLAGILPVLLEPIIGPSQLGALNAGLSGAISSA